jgi:hypothetical protein
MANTPVATGFCNHICPYNAAFTFTSLGVELDQTVQSGGPYVFCIHGGLYHQLGTLMPEPQNEEHAAYSQLYFYDPSTALAWRMAANAEQDGAVMAELQAMLL